MNLRSVRIDFDTMNAFIPISRELLEFNKNYYCALLYNLKYLRIHKVGISENVIPTHEIKWNHIMNEMSKKLDTFSKLKESRVFMNEYLLMNTHSLTIDRELKFPVTDFLEIKKNWMKPVSHRELDMRARRLEFSYGMRDSPEILGKIKMMHSDEVPKLMVCHG